VLKSTDNCPLRSLIISCCLSVLLSDLIGEVESASLFKHIKGFCFLSDRNKLARLAERDEKIESWDLSLVEYPTQKCTKLVQQHQWVLRRRDWLTRQQRRLKQQFEESVFYEAGSEHVREG
jgi:hypothetical protein